MAMTNIKDYLGYENARNKTHAQLYVAVLRTALGEGSAVLIGHHLTFELDGNIDTENEVPSADCLMFDHDIMKAVFGKGALPLMVALATRPCEQRDELLYKAFTHRFGLDPVEYNKRFQYKLNRPALEAPVQPLLLTGPTPEWTEQAWGGLFSDHGYGHDRIPEA